VKYQKGLGFFFPFNFVSYDILRVSGDNQKEEEEEEDSLILHEKNKIPSIL
jgi:hypothetical protein